MKNEPAFPGVDDEGDPYPGMTLRDYFAAKAMQAYLPQLGLQGAVEMAWVVADAMMEAREK